MEDYCDKQQIVAHTVHVAEWTYYNSVLAYIVSGSSRGWHQTPVHPIFYAGKSLIFGTAVLRGATPLCHHIVQLISLEQYGEEMYLSLRLCLGFLYSTLQVSEQQ